MLDTKIAVPADAAQERRSARFAARHILWDESRLPRLRSCGRSVCSRSDGVTVKVSTLPDGSRVAGFGGVQTCGSAAACPVCSAKIAAHRQSEIERALDAWLARDGRVVLATFTMRHRDGQRLKTLWDGLSKAWARVTGGRGWEEDQLGFGTLDLVQTKKGSVVKGRIRSVRVTEVTHGENGWHVHVHALLLLPGNIEGESDAGYRRRLGVLEDRMFGRWSSALVAAGFSAPTRTHGVDFKLMTSEDVARHSSEYLTKTVYAAIPTAKKAALEAARGDLKRGRYGNRTPFQVLEDVVKTGDLDDLETWWEWERASKGRRMIAWSRGLRDELLTGEEELTDEQIAEQDQGGDVELGFGADVYRVIARKRLDWAVLAAFQRSKDEGRAFVYALVPEVDQAESEDLAAIREDAAVRARARSRGVRRS